MPERADRCLRAASPNVGPLAWLPARPARPRATDYERDDRDGNTRDGHQVAAAAVVHLVPLNTQETARREIRATELSIRSRCPITWRSRAELPVSCCRTARTPTDRRVGDHARPADDDPSDPRR